ncbi:DHA2 family efflux MFS transporter permease subunit [Rubneribacter sp.]|nr:DHA2 family efflux MFS transporter permease subunit [Candidatus Rubneribacter avistercoris]
MGLTRGQLTMVAVLLVGALLAVLNQTLLTPALPTIMDHLSIEATTAQWLTSGYSLVEAVVIPLNAYLLGRFSSRRLYVGGIALFALGSALCAMSPSFAFLLMGRILQACATGVVMPLVFTLILLIFPRERRGGAMGVIGLIISFAPAVGPSLSGVLVDNIGWRALFMLVTVLAVGVVIASALSLKNFEGFDRTSFDAPSAALLLVGMVSLLYGLSTSTSSDAPWIPALLMLAGLGVLALFVRRQTRLEHPMLQVRVLKHREFATLAAIVTLLYGVLIGGSVVFPLYVQNALGASATLSGLAMLPGALVGAVCGLAAGRLFDRRGVRGIALVGAFALVIGTAGYALLGESSPLAAACVAYTVVCVGLQALITPLNTWGINSLPNSSLPHGNAIVATMEQVGGSLGTAFVVSLTALAGLLTAAPAGSAQHSFAGCHLAFLGILALAAIICALIAALVRDRKPARDESRAAGQVPGVERPWLVSDLMNPKPATLGTRDRVRDAVAIMQRTETSGLPIVGDDGSLAGFLSDGDILKCLARHDSSRADGAVYVVQLESASLRERIDTVADMGVMRLATKSVVSVEAGDRAEDAFRTLAEKRIKKVPVVSDGKLVGTLSRRNVMKALSLMES